MGGSIPSSIQKMGAALHLSGCEKLIYAIKHLKTPPEPGSKEQKAIPYEEYIEEEVKEERKTMVKSKKNKTRDHKNSTVKSAEKLKYNSPRVPNKTLMPIVEQPIS